MTFFSVDFSGGVDSIANSFTINANKMAEGTLPLPIDFWDLSIDPQHFSEMEIMCSPQITSGNRVILESLVEKYNCGIKITDSELMGKI